MYKDHAALSSIWHFTDNYKSINMFGINRCDTGKIFLSCACLELLSWMYCVVSEVADENCTEILYDAAKEWRMALRRH
jgi:hypothetical protein